MGLKKHFDRLRIGKTGTEDNEKRQFVNNVISGAINRYRLDGSNENKITAKQLFNQYLTCTDQDTLATSLQLLDDEADWGKVLVELGLNFGTKEEQERHTIISDSANRINNLTLAYEASDGGKTNRNNAEEVIQELLKEIAIVRSHLTPAENLYTVLEEHGAIIQRLSAIVN